MAGETLPDAGLLWQKAMKMAASAHVPILTEQKPAHCLRSKDPIMQYPQLLVAFHKITRRQDRTTMLEVRLHAAASDATPRV